MNIKWFLNKFFENLFKQYQEMLLITQIWSDQEAVVY